jgi:hypothetical protein
MTASAAGAVAPVLGQRYQPWLLLYVVSARDLGQSAQGPLLAEEAWVQYQRGRFSLRGWLAAHSTAFTYYLLYRQWLDPLRWPAARSPSGTTATGFFALDAHLSLSSALWTRTQRSYDDIAAQPLSPAELAGFSQLVDQSGRGMQVVVVEAPVHERLRRWAQHTSFYDDAITHMLHAVRQRRVAFWRAPTRGLIPPHAWVDFVHLDRTGAARFSEWLGARIAAAVHAGRLDVPPRS